MSQNSLSTDDPQLRQQMLSKFDDCTKGQQMLLQILAINYAGISRSNIAKALAEQGFTDTVGVTYKVKT
ncbi:hypothetical protein TI05_01475, partial [Achromatium sp. WMS3]